jgi:hypothetical protein
LGLSYRSLSNRIRKLREYGHTVPAPEKQNHQWEIPEWTGGSIETATPCDLEN